MSRQVDHATSATPRWARFLFLCGVLCLAAAALATVAPGARATGSIVVSVADKTTGAPLSGIRVRVYRLVPVAGWVRRGSCLTAVEPAGSAAFADLPAGRYIVEVDDLTDTYAPQMWNRKYSCATANRIVLEDGQTITRSVALTIAGQVSGVVTDTAGDPMKGIEVVACDPVQRELDFNDGGLCFGAGTLTAEDGSYTLKGLYDGGDWRVSFQHDVVEEIGGLSSGLYVDHCYGSLTYDFPPPTLLTILAGQTTTANTQMQRTAVISGTITTKLGLPVRDVAVTAYLRDAAGKWRSVSGMCCGDDGKFEIRQLPPGQYRVGIWDGDRPEAVKYYRDTFYPSEAEILDLGEGEQAAISAVIWGDRLAPTPQAPYAAKATKGSTAALRYRVRDPRPGGPTATVRILVKTLGGRRVKDLRVPSCRVNRWHALRFACDLHRNATYRFYVFAIDAGGNHQTRIAVNKLRVL